MNHSIHNKISKTLESLEGIERAKANPFLYGKVMNKMSALAEDPVYEGKVVLRYIVITLALIALNITTLYLSHVSDQKKANIEVLADEYTLNSTFHY